MNVYLFVLMIINMILHNNLENMKKIKLKIKSNTI